MAAAPRMLRQASRVRSAAGRREFHYRPAFRSGRSTRRNAPETDTEKAGLQYVLDHPGTNYYGGESLGGRRYFTAVLIAESGHRSTPAPTATTGTRAVPKKDFKAGDVMGGLVVARAAGVLTAE